MMVKVKASIAALSFKRWILRLSFPYTISFPRLRTPWRISRAWFLVPLLALSCLIYGFLFALAAPYVVIPFLFPLLLLAILVIWALPATDNAPTALLDRLYLAFFIGLVTWPNYLALSIPGLPWITVARLTGAPLAFVLLICLSVSSDVRAKLASVLAASPWIWKLMVSFVALQAISIGFSEGTSESINRFVNAQFNWTMIFFASCYFFLKPGRALLWSYLLWGMAIFVGVLAALEHTLGHVLWAGHIPSFLAIEDPSVRNTLAGSMRDYSNRYRSTSTFGTPLGLAEYIALAFPFVLYFVLDERSNWRVRAAAAFSVPFLLYAVNLTDARLGLIGCLISLIGYGLFWGLDRWRRRSDSIIGPAFVMMYPAFFIAAVGVILAIGRIRVRVLGDGSQTSSNEARLEQVAGAMPKIFSQPWGHGIGMGAETLGFRSPGGLLTIDSYYLTILLEYGVIGFAVYYGMFVLSIYKAGKCLWLDKDVDREFTLHAPIIMALTNFLVIKSVFSEDGNHPLLFMMMGIVAALAYRQKTLRAPTS